MSKLHLRLLFLLLGSSPTLFTAQSTPIALTGTLVMPQEVIPHGIVLMENGRIVASGAEVKVPAGTKIVAVDGVIAPGFIDLHNHLTYNLFPRWKPAQEFGNRYDWQQKPIYHVLIEAPHAGMVQLGLDCEMERYAEIKAITEGETSVVGGLQKPCSNGLARNLDYNNELDGHFGKTFYDVFPFQTPDDQMSIIKAQLAGTPRASLLIHVAEGSSNDASATREFTMLKARDLLVPGVSLIHGVGLLPEHFAEMAREGVGFIWSPRSNIELYGDTARVAAAKTAKVQMAIAPDWSPTGSDGMLGELNFASMWNQTEGEPLFSERDLVMMATSTPASLVGLAGRIGSLAPGGAADLIVVRKSGEDAYWSLTHAAPQDLELVVIGGAATYGDVSTMTQFGATGLEAVEVCGTSKALHLQGEPWAKTREALTEGLGKFGRKLAPLSECGN